MPAPTFRRVGASTRMRATPPFAVERTAMTDTSPAPASRALLIWLLPTGLLALAAIGILWALPRPTPMCAAIYPAPPGCSAGDPSVVMPFLVIIVLLYAAIVACALLLTRGRSLTLGLLTGGLVLVFAVGALAALTSVGAPITLY